jgi:hypothetical protein
MVNTMATSRRRTGAGSLGCLVTLLVVAAIVYFGVNIFEIYWRFYEYQDAMKQQVRFAASNPNDVIARRLRSAADSLELPEAAGQVYVQRKGHDISIESEYYERIELPLYVREQRFHPHAEGTF